ncbi:MAG: transcriptional regulator [Lachnospiraceae bacterium]|nr:transcriptional regulator [Lachnospiraceae bacterium]
MDVQQRVIELRKSTGMNRKEFCEYFEIPYRTVTEWERGTHKMPEYVLRMMEYQIRMEKLKKSDLKQGKEV